MLQFEKRNNISRECSFHIKYSKRNKRHKSLSCSYWFFSEISTYKTFVKIYINYIFDKYTCILWLFKHCTWIDTLDRAAKRLFLQIWYLRKFWKGEEVPFEHFWARASFASPAPRREYLEGGGGGGGDS